MCSPIKAEPTRPSLDRAIAQEANHQRSSEEQIGEYAVKLIHSERKVESTSKQLEQSVAENTKSKQQIEELIVQLSREILLKKNLEELFKLSQQELHFSRGEIKRLEIEKERLVRQVSSYQTRIKELETELAQEKAKSRDSAKLTTLKNDKEKKETNLEHIDRTRKYVLITGTAAGLLAGGWAIGLYAFVGSLAVYFVPGTSILEEMVTKQEVSDIDKKIAAISPQKLSEENVQQCDLPSENSGKEAATC